MPETALAESPLPTCAYAHLSNQVVARVTGPGARTFLNGQFSQSLDDVTPAQSPRAAACTPKGRAYCLTRFVAQDEGILLNLPRDLADPILTQLNKYLMLFRGTTMSLEPEYRIIGLLGHDLADQLSAGASNRLHEPGTTESLGNHRLLRTNDTAEGLARYEFWQSGPLSPEQQVFAPDSATALSNWQATEIAAGIASLSAASREAYVPQMLNWQHLNGIHFKKGCYTGQEVIARMHFLGQLKKSLYRLQTRDTDNEPATGAAIHSGDRAVGEVVNAVRFADGRTELLAVLRHDADFSQLSLASPGQRLQRLPLPYAVPEQESDT